MATTMCLKIKKIMGSESYCNPLQLPEYLNYNCRFVIINEKSIDLRNAMINLPAAFDVETKT